MATDDAYITWARYRSVQYRVKTWGVVIRGDVNNDGKITVDDVRA